MKYDKSCEKCGKEDYFFCQCRIEKRICRLCGCDDHWYCDCNPETCINCNENSLSVMMVFYSRRDLTFCMKCYDKEVVKQIRSENIKKHFAERLKC